MDIQKFIQYNIPEVDSREEFTKYKTLKECLDDPKLYDRTQAASLFDEFLYVKDKLFGEAMDNWLKKRGSK